MNEQIETEQLVSEEQLLTIAGGCPDGRCRDSLVSSLRSVEEAIAAKNSIDLIKGENNKGSSSNAINKLDEAFMGHILKGYGNTGDFLDDHRHLMRATTSSHGQR